MRSAFYMFFPGGGIGRYTHELASRMAALDDLRVEVLCTPDFEWRDTDSYPVWDGLRSISHPVPTLRRVRFIRGQFINPRLAIQHAVDTGLDVIHFSNVNHLTFPYWRAAFAASGVRMAISAHDVKRQKSILNRWWEERQLKATYRFADALFVHSEYQARELMAFADVPREQIHVVPHGLYAHGAIPAEPVPALRRALGWPEEACIGLFFGQIRDEKNLARTLRALAEVPATHHLVVAGSEMGFRHRSQDYYQALARDLGIADRVHFRIGFVPDDEVGRLFKAADWAALPYREHFTSQSGVLNVAAHYECPVLVSTSPVLRETVEESDIGVVCPGDTVEAIAEGIEAIAQRLASGYQHDFAAYRERYSWETNARRTLEVYHQISTRRAA